MDDLEYKQMREREQAVVDRVNRDLGKTVQIVESQVIPAKRMFLNVRTAAEGSGVKCDVGFSQEQWDKLGEPERQAAIQLTMSNLLDVWVSQE